MSTETPSVNESDATTEPTPAHRNDLMATATETARKRARWEGLRVIPCPGTHRINVANESYGDDAGEHTYTVTIAPDGMPTDCTCPAAEHQPGPCKHAVKCAGAHDAIATAMGTDDAPDELSMGTTTTATTTITTMADKLRADGRLDVDENSVATGERAETVAVADGGTARTCAADGCPEPARHGRETCSGECEFVLARGLEVL